MEIDIDAPNRNKNGTDAPKGNIGKSDVSNKNREKKLKQMNIEQKQILYMEIKIQKMLQITERKKNNRIQMLQMEIMVLMFQIRIEIVM